MNETDLTVRLAENLGGVRSTIAEAARVSGRPADAVRLVAVTKYVDVVTIRALLGLGVRDLGENRVQQLLERIDALGSADADLSTPSDSSESRPHWHMIGHLQRNKVRKLLANVRIVHAVDSERLAAEIDRQAGELGVSVDAMLEVNVSGEDTKHGVTPEDAFALAESMSAAEHVRLSGLMTMAPFYDDPEQTRPVFARLRQLLEDLHKRGAAGEACCELSMGMSNDYRIAIEEGATIVRVGTALVEGASPSGASVP